MKISCLLEREGLPVFCSIPLPALQIQLYLLDKWYFEKKLQFGLSLVSLAIIILKLTLHLRKL